MTIMKALRLKINQQKDIYETKYKLENVQLEFEDCSQIEQKYSELINGYIKYDNIRNEFKKEFNLFEKKWFKWNEKEFICWIRYKMGYFDVCKDIPKGGIKMV